MTDTAGVNRPSAMTQLAPNNVQPRNAIRTTLVSLIQAPLTERPAKSLVESIVSLMVSTSGSPAGVLGLGVNLSRPRYRLRSIYKTNVPPTIRSMMNNIQTFPLIVSGTKDDPRILYERDQSKRPHNATGCSNNVVNGRGRISGKDPSDN